VGWKGKALWEQASEFSTHPLPLFSTNFIVFIIQNLSGKNLRNLSKLNSGDNASKRNVPFEGI